MHWIQKNILALTRQRDIEGMKLRELGELVGEKHPQKIKHHLNRLRVKGLLGQNKALEQTTKIALENHQMFSIPILGAANCGDAALSATEVLEGFLNVSPSMLKKQKGLFAIRAVGLSMDKAEIGGKNIEDGDFIIVNPKDRNPKNGDYVLSIINGAANIKKFVMDEANRQVILASESSHDIAPIYIHMNDNPDYFVNGKVMAVIKKPKS